MNITVYIPAYNREGWLAETIESVLKQTLLAREIIVVDDGSTDGTRAVAESFAGKGVKCLARPHGGIPVTRNAALEAATGEWIVGLGSDDILMPWALEAHAANVQRDPSLMVSYGDQIATDSNCRPLQLLKYADWRGRSEACLGQMLLECVLPDSGSMIHRGAFERFGGYDVTFPRAQDYAWWSHALPGLRVGHCGVVMAFQRWHSANTSTPTVRYDVRHDERVRAAILERHGGRIRELFPEVDWGMLAEKSRGAGLFLWGAGSQGKTVKAILELAGIEVTGVIDRREGAGTEVPAGFFGRWEGVAEKPFVLVSSMYVKEIGVELEARGFVVERDWGTLYGRSQR